MKPSVKYRLLDASAKDEAFDRVPIHCIRSRCHCETIGVGKHFPSSVFPFFRGLLWILQFSSGLVASLDLLRVTFSVGLLWSGKVTATLQHERVRLSSIACLDGGLALNCTLFSRMSNSLDLCINGVFNFWVVFSSFPTLLTDLHFNVVSLKISKIC